MISKFDKRAGFVLLFYVLMFSIIPQKIKAQGKRDYIWLLGGNRGPTTDSTYMGFTMDFNNQSRKLYVQDRPNAILRQNNASICDINGNLLMFSGGCNIYDKNFQVMPNGKINDGFIWPFYCKDGDYAVFNGLLFLPPFANKNEYYLFHHFDEFDVDTISGSTITKILMSKIDMNLNGGLGAVTEKDQQILAGSFTQSDLTAVRHTNNKDWWISSCGKANNKYYLILFTEDGVKKINEQAIGISIPVLDLGGSQSCFSPDGKKFARMVPSKGLFLMDFDRETGMLSNFINIPTGKETSEYTVGVAFSPNSRFIYLINRLDLFQYDTRDSNSQTNLVHIDTWDGYTEGGIWAAGFAQARLGPDCKIYIRTGTSNQVMHIINNPNNKGKNCNFIQHGVKLPARNHASIPNLVNYRLGYEDVCDSTINITKTNIAIENYISVSPNPTNSILNFYFNSPLNNKTLINIFSFDGKLLIQKSIMPGQDHLQLNIEEMPNGYYLYKIYSDDSDFLSGKIVKY